MRTIVKFGNLWIIPALIPEKEKELLKEEKLRSHMHRAKILIRLEHEMKGEVTEPWNDNPPFLEFLLPF